MKRLILTVFIIGLFINVASTQEMGPMHKALSVRALFLDYQSQNGGELSNFGAYHRGFEIGYQHNIAPNFNLYVPFKAGVVTSHNTEVDCLHKTVYGLDAQMHYLIQREAANLVPFLVAGVGGVIEKEGDFNAQVPLGFGLQYKIADHARLVWQSTYRVSFAENRNNLHHGLGFIYGIRKGDMKEMPMEKEEEAVEALDSDGDGINDNEDLCPLKPGLAELNGCPDTDGDGIADYKDKCPNYVGLATFDGCPDSDGDGIPDNDDECPNMAGLQSNNGCPDKDTDGDGVMDNVDKCPNMRGTVNNNGCPEVADQDGDGVPDAEDKCPTKPGLRTYGGCPDSDGDGLDDSRDRCPNAAGPVDNNGCPKMEEKDRQVLDVAMRAVQFDTGKATLKSESYRVLDQIVDILQRYPNYILSIEGHTDNTGSAQANESLSKRRAKACYDYLVGRGISTTRVSHQGFGEARPIADNSTLNGRTLNRRVEFNVILR